MTRTIRTCISSPVLFPGGRNADMSANITCEGRTRKDGRRDGRIGAAGLSGCRPLLRDMGGRRGGGGGAGSDKTMVNLPSFCLLAAARVSDFVKIGIAQRRLLSIAV